LKGSARCSAAVVKLLQPTTVQAHVSPCLCRRPGFARYLSHTLETQKTKR
jgi:hypothetical protein